MSRKQSGWTEFPHPQDGSFGAHDQAVEQMLSQGEQRSATSYQSDQAAPARDLAPTHETKSSKHPFVSAVGRVTLGNKIGRRLVAGALVVTTGIGFYSREQDPPAHGYSGCIDGAHDLIKEGNTSDFLGFTFSKDAIRGTINSLSLHHYDRDNRTWNDVAATLTQRWGYSITGSAEAQANPDLARYGTDGKLEQTIGRAGTFCVALAAPQITDEVVVDGKHTVDYYWSDHATAKLTLQEFFQLNPGLSGDKNQVLEAGKELVFSKDPNTGLVLRRMTEQTLADITPDAALIGKINHSQPAHIGINHNEDAYLPYNTLTSYMKEHGITNEQVLAQFVDSYKNIGYGQVLQPKQAKPVEKPETNPEATVDPGDMTDEPRLLAAAAKLMAMGGEWKTVGMFYDFFLRKGLTPVAISGLLGNCFGESGCDSERVQGNPQDHPDSKTLPKGIGDQLGYGWMQWTTEYRQQHMKHLAAQLSLPEGDPQVQLQLIWDELNSGTYKHVLKSLMRVKTPQRASDIVLGPHQSGDLLVDGYENPVAATARKYTRREFAIKDYAMFIQQVEEAA